MRRCIGPRESLRHDRDHVPPTNAIGLEFLVEREDRSHGFFAVANDYESMKEKIVEQAKRHFKPEFLNRLDDIIVFHMLEKADLVRIVDLEIDKLFKRVRDKNITVFLDDAAKGLLIEEGYDPQYGARPMRRAVEKYLEDQMAEHLLRGDVKEGDTVRITRREGEKALKFSVDDPPIPDMAPSVEEAAAVVAADTGATS